jgi:hypothetical protein
MDSPISSILAEIPLQKLKKMYYLNFINNKHIRYINRYYDYIFIVIYDYAYSTAEQIKNDHNKMHKNMNYTLKNEESQTLYYLDLKLQRQKITIGIYHKHTQTGISIHT